MFKRVTLYLLVAGISFSVALCIRSPSLVQGAIAAPGVAGLLAALWEIFKSRMDHGYRLEEDATKNAFILSATSHMAQTAFDKHVAFCEAYVRAVNDGLMELLKEGPSVRALTFAGNLSNVRRNSILWETAEVDTLLDAFEKALREIGAGSDYSEHMPAGPARSEYVEKVFATFSAVLGITPAPDMKTPEIASSHIIEGLREHLGISQLTSLRKYYLDEATKRAK